MSRNGHAKLDDIFWRVIYSRKQNTWILVSSCRVGQVTKQQRIRLEHRNPMREVFSDGYFFQPRHICLITLRNINVGLHSQYERCIFHLCQPFPHEAISFWKSENWRALSTAEVSHGNKFRNLSIFKYFPKMTPTFDNSLT